jgi:hypothetical protein
MNPLRKATKDNRNKTLIDRVAKHVQLKYEPSEDNGWGCEIRNNIAYIWYCECSFPAASLAHELLHIDTQLKGYKRIMIGYSRHESTELFMRLMNAMDNELQHHKFYEEFIRLGFTKESFYAEDDIKVESYLRDEVLPARHENLIHILPDFLSVIAPGGTISRRAKADILESFYKICQGKYENSLREIKKLFDNWRHHNSYNAIPFIREVMLTLYPKPNYTWFGFSKDERPPNQGFFVDEKFEVI